MKKGAVISIISATIFVAIVILAVGPALASIGPIGLSQETLGREIRDSAVTRYSMMTDHIRLQEDIGRAIRDNSQARFEWNTNAGRFQEELGKAIRDDSVLRQRGAGNMQEEIGRALVNYALLSHKVHQFEEGLGIAIRDEASTRYNSMFAAGKHQEQLGEAIKMDAVIRFKGSGPVGLNQEEISVPVGEDGVLPYTDFLLVGMTLGAAASCFFSWTISCPTHEGAKTEEDETDVSIAA